MNKDEWLDYGVANNFVSKPSCYFHDTLPLTWEEDRDENLGDECIIVARVYQSPEEAEAVISNNTREEG